jgi:Asp-tRNA(Asn)/Glu-tRNA(Gln) amidotransferase A subunit family amidase
VAVSPDLAGLTIAAASKELAARRLSAVELVEGILATIDRDNERLNAYLYVDREGALAAARRAEAALDDGSAGPLAGIPICVKDVIHVAGMPTTAGSSGWSRLPTADAVAVARLREAGAVVIGKGNTNEFAFGIDGRNPHRGDCRNPRDPTRISGGSSAGPACATRAGLALGGLGTDTSGSLRVPASLCGLVAGPSRAHGRPPDPARRGRLRSRDRRRHPRCGRAPRVAWRRGTPGRAAAARAPRRDPHHHPVRRGGGRPPPVDRRPAATLRASGA